MADTETAEAQQPQTPQIPGIIAPPELDMKWAKVPTERPPKPRIGADGFTLRMADFGAYGFAPDHWPYESDMPRGAFPTRQTALPAPYTIYEKHEVWAENAADLYEAAIRDQWKPATEISWSSLEPLAEHVEAALDQIYSNISEQQYNSLQVMGGWFKEISYGYHEVKLYLSTQVFDQARHVEAFRKRALSNGGGLGVQSPCFFNRAVYASFKFTEYVIYVNIMRTSFLLALADFAEKLARSQADRQLFDNMASDLRRHLAYGIEHLKYYLQTQPDKRHNVHVWLDRAEMMMAADMKRDVPLREALILALGDTVAQGKERLRELRGAQKTKYLRTLEAATVRDRDDRMLETFKEAIANA
jgi:hypothetical protein